MHPPQPSPLFGILAEFDTPQKLVDAATKTRAEGYTVVEGYSSFPIEGLHEALEHPTTKLPVIIFLAGLIGFLGGFGLQYWVSVIAYPINVSGRPFNSWQQFVPPAFETTVLLASLMAVVAMLMANGLPRPHHPLFNVPRFEMASDDRFFLCIEATDPKFDREGTWRFLSSLNPHEISEVRDE